MNEQESINQQAGDSRVRHLTSDSEKLNRWLYHFIRPYINIKGKILEFECGGGDISRLFVQDSVALRIGDPDQANCELLRDRFNGEPLIKGFHQLNLSDPVFETTYDKFLGRFDTLVSVAALDPYINDPIRLTNAKKLLRNRGRLITLLPACIALFDESEEGFDEWRRWNRRDIKSRLGKGCEILKMQFFCISGNSQFGDIRELKDQSEQLPKNSYHDRVPVFRFSTEISPKWVGLHVIAIVRKIVE